LGVVAITVILLAHIYFVIPRVVLTLLKKERKRWRSNNEKAIKQPICIYLVTVVVHVFGQRSRASLIPPVLIGCIKRPV